jgi:hypothetical protein
MPAATDPIYKCPKCEADVLTPNLALFRCPVCGYKTEGIQLSLFVANTAILKPSYAAEDRRYIYLS